MSHRPVVIVALLLLSGCGAANEVAAAAVTVGAAVAAAAVNRAVTQECWGSCQPGHGCDEDTGLCVPLSELEGKPARGVEGPEDRACILEDDGTEVCPDDADLADPLEAAEGMEAGDPLEGPLEVPATRDPLEADERPAGPDPLESAP